MHELGIADSVFDAVRTEASRHRNARVCKVSLRVGELSGVNPEALRFCFESLVKGSSFDPLALDIEYCPRRQQCDACQSTFNVVGCDTVCPTCGSERTKCVGGTELELSYLELEEQ